MEKPFEFLENHFIAGASFESINDLAGKLKAFETRVNDRVHATIKTTPDQLIAEDRRAFTPLPESRYVGVHEETRKVTLGSAGNLDRLTFRFRERFPDYEHFLEKLLTQKRLNVRHHLACGTIWPACLISPPSMRTASSRPSMS